MGKCQVFQGQLEEYRKKYADLYDREKEAIGRELEFLPYDVELEFKKEYVRRLFKVRGFDVEIEKISPSPITKAYRNKMEYSFGDMGRGGELNLGLHVPGRYYDVMSATDSDMVDSDFNKIVESIQTYCREKGYKKFYKKDQSGLLRNLNVRKGKYTGEILIGISTTYDYFDEEDFVKFLLDLDLEGEIVGIIHLKNDSPAEVVKKGDDDKVIYGRDYYIEKILGLEFRVSFFSFFQTNSMGAEVLYTRVRELVKTLRPKKALDLFCGTGTISQILSGEVEELIGVEIVEEAVEVANKNAKRNGIENCKYIAGDVFKVLKNTDEDMTSDLIILDPPRSGVSAKALDKIISFDVKNILYVSCNPRTLAIDYEKLHEAGYEIKHIECVEMYSGTKHSESIALLSRK